MKFTVLLGIFSVVVLINVAAAQKLKRSTEFANQLESKLKTEFEMVIDEFFRFVKQLVVNLTDDSGSTPAPDYREYSAPASSAFPEISASTEGFEENVPEE